MRTNFIAASSTEGKKYREDICRIIAREPHNKNAQDFLNAFDAEQGCDPLDFLDYFPHGGVGTQGPANKCDLG